MLDVEKAQPSLASASETTLARTEFDEACDLKAASVIKPSLCWGLCQHLDPKLCPLGHGAGQMSALASFDIRPYGPWAVPFSMHQKLRREQSVTIKMVWYHLQ